VKGTTNSPAPPGANAIGDLAEMTLTVTTTTAPIVVEFFGQFYCSPVPTDYLRLMWKVDGGSYIEAADLWPWKVQMFEGGFRIPMVLTAGSHTIKVGWRSTVNTSFSSYATYRWLSIYQF
jgi:hypothetical protein